jgi:hypothetical protein
VTLQPALPPRQNDSDGERDSSFRSTQPVSLVPSFALEGVLEIGDEWQSWRALRLTDEAPEDIPRPPLQDPVGGLEGPGGRLSPGATGETLCHLAIIGLGSSPASAIASDWLEEMRTPAGAWLDPPSEVPGRIEEAAAGRVWATASAACGLLASGRDAGARAITLLGAEADNEGRFTGGTYPTFAAAGAFWLAQGPRTEMAEWALRWAREWDEEWWGPWEFVTGLMFWGAAGIPAENASVERFIERLGSAANPQGWPGDPELTLRALEVLHHFGA